MQDLEYEALSWGLPMQHLHTIQAEARHVDMFGHVNNAWYVAWAMDCAWGHSEALGLDFTAYERVGIGCVVREHRFTYLAAAHAGDGVVIGTAIIRNDGKLRLTRGFELRRAGDDRLLVRGETDFVSISLASGRATRMPADYVRLYAPADATQRSRASRTQG
ncbi:thioesterase family protein [Parvularcula sp. IMCC14364]|uniref:acyl-CoA thioesterase n=1 Tax=Parvularcula sp. IMCC14364 TaxID=3067902 RepID=UPI002740D3B3|nr:thioesterase family protein [Parvularcula sp. IMCC14364]